MQSPTKELHTEQFIFNTTRSFKDRLRRAADAEMLPMASWVRRVLAKAIEEAEAGAERA